MSSTEGNHTPPIEDVAPEVDDEHSDNDEPVFPVVFIDALIVTLVNLEIARTLCSVRGLLGGTLYLVIIGNLIEILVVALIVLLIAHYSSYFIYF